MRRSSALSTKPTPSITVPSTCYEPVTWASHGKKYLPTSPMTNWRSKAKGGGPYTNEAVGAENYGTISYVAESPHEQGVIWVGTDDGLVQLTKDGGENWQDVTPKGLKECLVNAIDVSPHDPATAYIATTRYKFNDHTPGLYKTTNYGKTWTNISAGIPTGAYTRVVREDDQVKGLLLAGTETGVYISWNDGKEWKPFNLNLPVTPINDLIIKHGDVIVATSGRSFWVLDDLGLLRQYQADADSFLLYQPEDIILTNGGSQLDGTSASFKGTHPFRGVNPASGAVIYYQLPKLAGKTVISLEIKDSKGRTVRKLSSKKDSLYQRYAGGPPPAPTLSKSIGLNRFVWDLRHPIMAGIPGVYIESSYRGHKVSPGTYSLTLSYGDQEKTTSFTLKPNPLYPTTTKDYATYDQFMTDMEVACHEMHQTVNILHKLQGRLAGILKEMPKESTYDSARTAGKALVEKMKEWDKKMVQRKSKAYDDVENFPNKFTANYLFLINQTESDIPRVNQPSRDRLAELNVEWKALKATSGALLEQEIPAYNKLLWELGIGAVWGK